MLALATAIYEAPCVQTLGPQLSALTAGFAVWWLGELHLTPLGEAYLQSLETEQCDTSLTLSAA